MTIRARGTPLGNRVTDMRYKAKLAGKAVPSRAVCLQLIADCGMICPRCGKNMTFHGYRTGGMGDVVSLQHRRDGGYGVLCCSCNASERCNADDDVPLGYKTCGSCGVTKPHSEFYFNAGYPRTACKPCYRENQNQRA